MCFFKWKFCYTNIGKKLPIVPQPERKNKIRFFREKYNINNLIRMCKKYNPDIKYLVDVLLRS